MRIVSMGILRLLRWPYLLTQWSHTNASQTTVSHAYGLETVEITSLPKDECQSSTDPGLLLPTGNSTEFRPLPSSSKSALPRNSSQCNTPQPRPQRGLLLNPEDSISRTDGHPADFRDDGTPLPGSSKKLFRSIQASSSTWSNKEYEDRFEYVKGELIKAVVEKRRQSARYITYSLSMIGASRDTATPHILIECRRSALKALQELFYSCASDRLYCYRDSVWDKLFQTEPKPPKPLFKFFFLHTTQDPIRRYASLAGCTASVSWRLSNESLCGALVKHQGRTATVGLVLDIDEVSHVMTVKHLFDNYNCNNDDFDNSYGSNTKSNWNYLLQVVKDLKAEALKIRDWSNFELSRLYRYRTSIFSRAVQPKTNVAEARAVESPSILPVRVPDLDWAVFEVQDCLLKRPLVNIIFPTTLSSPVHLKCISPSPRYHGVPVYMVSAIEGIRKGYLFQGVTYLGPEPGRDPCGVWTMVLDSSQGLVPGECGSIVVDQETFEVYGNVIGSNILENIYVVPFTQTAQQIQDTFNAAIVRLPKLESPPLDPVPVGSGGNRARAYDDEIFERDKHIFRVTFACYLLGMIHLVAQIYAGKPSEASLSNSLGFFILTLGSFGIVFFLLVSALVGELGNSRRAINRVC